MIKINGEEYTYSKFPNGEIKFPSIIIPGHIGILANIMTTGHEIAWIFENNEEFLVVQILAKELKRQGRKVRLFVPFCPYGQQDREMPGQIFSFKYFAQLVNAMDLDEVEFLDPHSNVMDAAINRSVVRHIDIGGPAYGYELLFYPDSGAAKKYSEVYHGKPYRFGNKKRNLDTGEIVKYEIIADRLDIEGKKVLIVDDLCMGGRTFKEAAKALKELGAAEVGLQITHFMPESGQFLRDFRQFGIDYVYTYFQGISQIPLRQFSAAECADRGIHDAGSLM